MVLVVRVVACIAFVFAINLFAIEIKAIKSEAFSKTINLEKKKVNLVLLFTSWCKSCKDAFAKAVHLQQKYLTSKWISVHLVSLDKNADDIERFCENFEIYGGSVIYFKNFDSRNVLSELLNNGIGYSGSIPHITLFEDSRVVLDGNYRIDPIIAYLEKLK